MLLSPWISAGFGHTRDAATLELVDTVQLTSIERGAVMQTQRFMLTLQGSGASSLTRSKVTGYLDLTARFNLITDIPAPAVEGHIRD